MARNYDRNSQLAQEIAHNISQFLSERLAEQYGIVTCTRVELTKDQHNVTAYISCYPELKNTTIREIIAPHKHDLIKHIRQRVPMRYIPKFDFALDTASSYTDKIDKLMNKL